MNKNVIVFDVETNGTQGSSVLSISAVKVNYDFESDKWIKVSEYDRFYFRNEGEKLNQDAIAVNGLTDEVIEDKRKGINYARTFQEDLDSFYIFCQDTNHYVAHNIKFDRSFIPFPLKHQFDTMMENINIVKAGINPTYGTYKWPKLMECAKFYKVPIEENQLHGSFYDVLITFRVLFRMSKHKLAKKNVMEFLKKN